MNGRPLPDRAAAEAADVAPGMPRILADLAGGRLGDSEAVVVADWLLATSNEEAPVWLVNRAVRIGRRTVSQRVSRTPVWRRLVAALVCDTRLQPRPIGSRAVAVEPRRLLYRVDSTEIDLEVGASQISGRLRMLGQVTPSTTTVTHAWVTADGPSGRLEADVDELGQFTLDGLAHGVHRLEIGLACELIEIPTVVL